MRRRIIQVIQLVFAVVFIFSSTAKFIDPTGTSIKLMEYLHYFDIHLFDQLTMLMAIVLCLFEFLCGFNLLLGHGRVAALFIGSAMMLVFLPLTGWLALTSAIDECGCFGDVLHLSNMATFLKNVVLTILLLLLIRYRRCLYQITGPTTYTLYKYIVCLFLGLVGIYGAIYEPLADFRPFLLGVNLRESVQSSSDVTYTCIYSKDGKEHSFAIDQLPNEDEGWEFVRTEEHAAETKSAIDFFVKDESGEVVTDELLEHEGKTILLVSASLDHASQHDIDKIEQLYEYSQLEACPFYCLTRRDEAETERWCYNTGAEYPFLYSDVTIIQTLCRSNPCLVVLEDGVIRVKKSLSQVDVTAFTSGKLNEQSSLLMPENAPMLRFFAILFLIFAPFSLFLLVEITQKLHKHNFKDSKRCVRKS